MNTPKIVYFGHSEDHAETDSGWQLRKNETSDNTGVETTLTSKFQPARGVHVSGSQSSGREEECMSKSRRHSLFPEATDGEIKALLDEVSGDDSLRSGPAKRIRMESEVMRQLVWPNENSDYTCSEEDERCTLTSVVAVTSDHELLREGSASSTSTERISTSTLPISSSTSKAVSKD